jgi:uncharacterized integral membrane protein
MKEYWNNLSFTGKLKLITYILLALMLIVFAFRNWQMISLRIFFVEFEIPTTILIVGSMILGFLISTILNNRKIHLKKKEIKLLQKEITTLKNPHESNESI